MVPAHGPTARAILGVVRLRGAAGATADEVEEATGLPHQTVSPAFSNLKKAGILVDSGSRRFTRLGRRVPAWAIDKDKEAQ